jgi:hypothetical protein
MSSVPILSLADYARAVARLARPFAQPEDELHALGLDVARYQQAGREWTSTLSADPTARSEFTRLYRAETRALSAGARDGRPAEPVGARAVVNVDETAMGAVPPLGPVLPFVEGTFRPAPALASSPTRTPRSEPNPDETQAMGIVLDLTLPFDRSEDMRSVGGPPSPTGKPKGPTR